MIIETLISKIIRKKCQSKTKALVFQDLQWFHWKTNFWKTSDIFRNENRYKNTVSQFNLILNNKCVILWKFLPWIRQKIFIRRFTLYNNSFHSEVTLYSYKSISKFLTLKPYAIVLIFFLPLKIFSMFRLLHNSWIFIIIRKVLVLPNIEKEILIKLSQCRMLTFVLSQCNTSFWLFSADIN